MNELIIGIGIFLIFEGLVYAAFPNGVKSMAEEIKKIPSESLRTFGLIAMILGLVIIWFVMS